VTNNTEAKHFLKCVSELGIKMNYMHWRVDSIMMVFMNE
jgi:hypothetical protein